MEDFGVNQLSALMDYALKEGRAVSIKLDGSPDWESIDHVASDPRCPPLIEARRASDGRTLVFSPARVVAVDVGEGPLG